MNINIYYNVPDESGAQRAIVPPELKLGGATECTEMRGRSTIYIYLYHDAATLQRKKLGYKTDILPRVVYNPLMFDILPACG